MATEADRDSQTQDTTGELEASGEQGFSTTATTPTFSLDDVNNIVGQAVEGAMRRVLPTPQPQRRAAPAIDPEPAGPTAEEYEADPMGAIGKIVNKALYPVRQQMGALQAFGLERIGGLTREVEGVKLAHYKDFKTEIDGEMANLDATLQADPNTLRLVHDTVVNRHLPEIIAAAVKEQVAATRGDAPSPGTTTGRTAPKTPGVPTPEELGFGPDQIDDINARGGPDAFARRVSGGRFANWDAFAKARQTMSATPRIGGRTVMPFARMEARKTKVVQ